MGTYGPVARLLCADRGRTSGRRAGCPGVHGGAGCPAWPLARFCCIGQEIWAGAGCSGQSDRMSGLGPDVRVLVLVGGCPGAIGEVSRGWMSSCCRKTVVPLAELLLSCTWGLVQCFGLLQWGQWVEAVDDFEGGLASSRMSCSIVGVLHDGQTFLPLPYVLLDQHA
jgi:hypothetical protein